MNTRSYCETPPTDGPHVDVTADDVMAAKAILQDPARLARGAFFSNEIGKPIDPDDLNGGEPPRLCILGAIAFETRRRVPGSWANLTPIWLAMKPKARLRHELMQVIERIESTNDNGTHGEIMSLMDEIETAMRKREAEA